MHLNLPHVIEEEVKTNEPASDLITCRPQVKGIVSVSSDGLEAMIVKQGLEVGQTSTSSNEVLLKYIQFPIKILKTG